MFTVNPGAADIGTGIPGEANGVFEVTGLARQHLNHGRIERAVAWTGAPAGTPSSVMGGPVRPAAAPSGQPAHPKPRVSVIGSRGGRSIALITVMGLAGSGWVAAQGPAADAPGPVVMHSDMDLLERFISLPVKPRSTWFETSELRTPGGFGPTDGTFLALLRHDEAGFDPITARLEEAGEHRGGFRAGARDWLRTERLDPVAREGDLLVYEGDAARRATPFEKDGLLGGVALPLDDGEHVLVVIGTS